MQQFVVYGAAVIVTVVLSLANVGLKALATPLWEVILGLRKFDFSPLMALSPLLFLVGGAYSLGAVLWLWVLHHMPLNKAFLFVSLTFIFVPLFSHLLLGERIGTGVLLATPIIILGISVAVILR